MTNEQLDAALARLQIPDTQNANVAAAHKTVHTFANLIGRKVWLKNANSAYTDGHEIGAPYGDKHFYQLVEHELAHLLFKSNFAAKEKFSNDYALQIKNALVSNGRTPSNDDMLKLAESIGYLVNVVEDHRIHSLWSMLYPGSYAILARYGRELLEPQKHEVHDGLVSYFLAVAYDVPNLPAGRLDRLRPAMVSALKKVERKGPEATFVICKWLVTQLVSELIRAVQGQPPPPDAGNASIATDLCEMPGRAAPQQGDAQSDGDQPDASQGDAPGSAGAAAPNGASAPKDGSQPQPQPNGAPQGNDGASNGAGWTPPKVEASVQDRLDALQELIGLAGSQHDLPHQMNKLLNDVQRDRHSRGTTTGESLARVGLDTDVNNEALLKRALASSESKMERLVEKMNETLQREREVTEQEWISRNAGARVQFHDVEEPLHKPDPMQPEDRACALRLKQLFSQVHNRRAKALVDSGAEIDVEAFIANRVGQAMNPIFKDEVSGRGFKTVVLVDRSSSMQGRRTRQVDRASKILRTALDLPYVGYETWGFRSDGNSTVHLTRVPKHIDVEGTMPPNGETPMHIAIRSAVNYLGVGAEKKQIIILTDGSPCFRSQSEKNLQKEVGNETRRARKQGINVTAIGIDNGVSAAEMAVMFGPTQHWTICDSDKLSDKLVEVVRKSFVNHLKHA